MKKVLFIAGMLGLFTMMLVACNNNPGSNLGSAKILLTDTSGYSEFQAWKASQNNYSYASRGPAVKRSVIVIKPRYRSMSTTNAYPAKAPQKKFWTSWSKSAKGAVIGGGSGAVIGAVIDKKNRPLGALIGGALGAGLGYGVGHQMDKKDGR